MNRNEISKARTVYALRELYRKYNPHGSVAKCEYFINRVMNGRKKYEQ